MKQVAGTCVIPRQNVKVMLESFMYNQHDPTTTEAKRLLPALHGLEAMCCSVRLWFRCVEDTIMRKLDSSTEGWLMIDELRTYATLRRAVELHNTEYPLEKIPVLLVFNHAKVH